jgi:hypothetical protein
MPLNTPLPFSERFEIVLKPMLSLPSWQGKDDCYPVRPPHALETDYGVRVSVLCLGAI